MVQANMRLQQKVSHGWHLPQERDARILQNPRSTALIARFDDAHDGRQNVVAHSSDFTIRLDELWKPERMRIAPKPAGHLAPDRRTTCCRKTVAWDRQHDPHELARLGYTDDVGNRTWVQQIVPARQIQKKSVRPAALRDKLSDSANAPKKI